MFLQREDCGIFFEWYTTSACKPSSTQESRKEVKCYLHDAQGSKVDLSPLIKTQGSYNFSDENGGDIHINVCRELAATEGGGRLFCIGKSAFNYW